MRSLSWARACMTLVALFCFLVGANAQKDLPYEYGFENYKGTGTAGTSIYEEDWTYKKDSEAPTYGNFSLDPSNPHTGSYAFRFRSTAAGYTQYLISPEFNASQGIFVSFWHMAVDLYGDKTFQVGYSTTTNDVSEFTWSDEVAVGSTYQYYENTFPVGTKYIAVKFTRSDNECLILDDFFFAYGYWGVWLEKSRSSAYDVLQDYLRISFVDAKALAQSAPCYVLEYASRQRAKTLADALNEGRSTAYLVDMRKGTFLDVKPYTLVSDEEVGSATYTKTLTGRTNKHQAWMLPFDYTITDDDVDNFKFYKINMIANAPDPGTEASDEMWVFLKGLKAGDVLHANMPYVYKPIVDVDEYVFATDAIATLKACPTDVVLKTETAEDIYSFYANYTNSTATAEDPFYYVGIDGSVSLGDNGTVTVGPNRWIIRKTSKFGDTPAYSRVMRFIDEEGTTAIESVETSEQTAEGEWYTISGVKLDGAPAEPGLYIVNGKKVLIK